MSIIRDINLKDEGHQRITWVVRHMPVLNAIGDRFRRKNHLQGFVLPYLCILRPKQHT